MAISKTTISQQKLQAEWLEVQAAQKDPALFEVLYRRYYTPIFKFIYRRTADEALTADLCSQVFLNAMEKLSTYKFKGVPFSAWLYRIASNEVAQHFRGRQKDRVVTMEESYIGEMIEEMHEEQDDGLLRSRLILALNELKIADVQLIEMRYFEKRSFKEISDILDIKESNAKVRTYRILERIRKKMK